MDNKVEQKMNEQDALAQKSAEEYARKHKDDSEPIVKAKERNSFGELVNDYVVGPVAGMMEKVAKRFDKAPEAPKSERPNVKLTGGSATGSESKIKGFSKKHVILIGGLLTTLIVVGVAMGSTGDKKSKKDDRENDRGAISGQHMTTMPKDYTELAAVKRRQQAEEERRRAEEEAKKAKERNKGREELKSSERVRDDRPPAREVVTKTVDPALEARLAREEALRQRKAAALSSPIGFEVKKR